MFDKKTFEWSTTQLYACPNRYTGSKSSLNTATRGIILPTLKVLKTILLLLMTLLRLFLTQAIFFLFLLHVLTLLFKTKLTWLFREWDPPIPVTTLPP